MSLRQPSPTSADRPTSCVICVETGCQQFCLETGSYNTQHRDENYAREADAREACLEFLQGAPTRLRRDNQGRHQRANEGWSKALAEHVRQRERQSEDLEFTGNAERIREHDFAAERRDDTEPK